MVDLPVDPAILSSYRTRSGLEVDLLAESEGRLQAFEIKDRERIAPTDTRALRRLAEASGDRWPGGLVLYR